MKDEQSTHKEMLVISNEKNYAKIITTLRMEETISVVEYRPICQEEIPEVGLEYFLDYLLSSTFELFIKINVELTALVLPKVLKEN